MQDSLFETPLPDGVTLLKGYLNPETQEKIVEKCRAVIQSAPLVFPTTKLGYKFGVSVTSVGDYGWFSNQQEGYHYRRKHPKTNQPFPKMPRKFREIAQNAAEEVNWIFNPDTCLINFYAPNTGKLGLHVDDTEEDNESPIVTFSLGESCQFAIGGLNKTDPVQRIIINSGDCLIMHRQGRMLYHGVEKLYPNSSQLLRNGGRISLTFRRNKPLHKVTF